MRTAKHVLASLAGAGILFTAVVGFAHTRSGRPLLRLLGRLYHPAGAVCPLGYDRKVSPAQRELARSRFAATHAGSALARARPALGFALDRTRREDVMAWSKAHGISCAAPASGDDLVCSAIPAALFPEGARALDVRSLRFEFGREGKLISLVALRRSPTALPVSEGFQGFVAEVGQAAGGAPATRNGTGAPAELQAGVLRQATTEYRFRNYYALARATNMGDGFLLTEEFRSLPD